MTTIYATSGQTMSIKESTKKPIQLVLQQVRQATLLLDISETITCRNNFDKTCLSDPPKSTGGGGMLCYVSFYIIDQKEARKLYGDTLAESENAAEDSKLLSVKIDFGKGYVKSFIPCDS